MVRAGAVPAALREHCTGILDVLARHQGARVAEDAPDPCMHETCVLALKKDHPGNRCRSSAKGRYDQGGDATGDQGGRVCSQMKRVRGGIYRRHITRVLEKEDLAGEEYRLPRRHPAPRHPPPRCAGRTG